jgi:hypothetical protein
MVSIEQKDGTRRRDDIRALPEQARMSQAVFANLTTGYVSQLERGEKRATGAALALLNVIRRKVSRPFCRLFDRLSLSLTGLCNPVSDRARHVKSGLRISRR